MLKLFESVFKSKMYFTRKIRILFLIVMTFAITLFLFAFHNIEIETKFSNFFEYCAPAIPGAIINTVNNYVSTIIFSLIIIDLVVLILISLWLVLIRCLYNIYSSAIDIILNKIGLFNQGIREQRNFELNFLKIKLNKAAKAFLLVILPMLCLLWLLLSQDTSSLNESLLCALKVTFWFLILFTIVVVFYTYFYDWKYIKNDISEKIEGFPLVPKFSCLLQSKMRYDKSKQLLILKGIMKEDEKNELLNISQDQLFQKAVQNLFLKSQIKKMAYNRKSAWRRLLIALANISFIAFLLRTGAPTLISSLDVVYNNILIKGVQKIQYNYSSSITKYFIATKQDTLLHRYILFEDAISKKFKSLGFKNKVQELANMNIDLEFLKRKVFEYFYWYSLILLALLLIGRMTLYTYSQYSLKYTAAKIFKILLLSIIGGVIFQWYLNWLFFIPPPSFEITALITFIIYTYFTIWMYEK